VLNLNASEHVLSLTLNGTGSALMTPTANKLLVTNSLTMNNNAKLDLADNDMIVQADAATRQTVLNTVTARIAAARNTGSIWSGRGITTSIAPTVAKGITGLAVMLNDNDLGSPLYNSFDGEAVDKNSVLVKYTWNGDTDVNGKIDADDYFYVDRGFASRADPLSPFSKGYHNGDLDYNGTIDADDYFLIDNAYLNQAGTLSNGITVGISILAMPATASVPEPAFLGFTLVGCLLATIRPRHRVKHDV
jgi:hypothetical protein